MAVVTDPDAGLEFYELSHPWGMYTPIFPGYEEIKLERITYHAKQGVMTHKITTIFHTSTHVNAPIHLLPETPAVGDLALDRFFGTDSTTPLPKKRSSASSPTASFPGRRWIGAFTCVDVWKIVVILCVITPCLAWYVMRSSLISS